jgi:hypothetical protein
MKNPFDEILSLSFDLGFLIVNSNVSDMNQFCKDCQMDSYNNKKIDGEKIRG